MADPYKVLGVAQDASQADIRKAYRRLAKKNHPDLNPGDAEAEKRFKEISAAYGIIGDEEKRGRYDRGEIDDTGTERPEKHFYRHYAEGEPGFKYYRQTSPGSADDLGDLFADLFAHARPGGREFHTKGPDLRYNMSIDFLDAVNGAKKTVTMPDGKTLNINIPAGFRDGQTLRLKGEGEPGFGGGAKGDALVAVSVRDHPVFRREGYDIHSILPITLSEALSGKKVRAETTSGAVYVTVPRNANSGETLRLRGKGVVNRVTGKPGDHLLELRIMLPKAHNEELEKFIADWEAKHPYNPRQKRGHTETAS